MPQEQGEPNRSARVGKVRSLLRSGAVAAILAQVWQALGSFLIQLLAARLLGAAGLAMVSLSYGVIILATALVSGMVGDTLTILDRDRPATRSALQGVAAVLTGVASLGGAAALVGFGVLTPSGGVAFVAACATFMIEELVRRLHMATLGFWRLLAIDSVAVCLTMAVIAGGWVLGAVSLTWFLWAIAAGQGAGLVLGWLLLPTAERMIVPFRRGAVREVAAFGAVRGVQVSLSPVVQTVSRILVTAAAGATALGQLEAARVAMAPAMLMAQGFGSFLLATYARRKSSPLEDLLRLARRASVSLAVVILFLAVLAGILTPWVGGLITGGRFVVEQAAVVGWGLFAAASASLQPFASLAAVRGAQRRVLAMRLTDSCVALSTLWIVLMALSWTPTATPFVLAAGLALGGVLVRRFVLRPLEAAERA